MKLSKPFAPEREPLTPCAFVGGRWTVLDIDVAERLEMTVQQLRRQCVSTASSTDDTIVRLTPAERRILVYQRKCAAPHGQGSVSSGRPVVAFPAEGLAMLLCATKAEACSRALINMIRELALVTVPRRSIH